MIRLGQIVKDEKTTRMGGAGKGRSCYDVIVAGTSFLVGWIPPKIL